MASFQMGKILTIGTEICIGSRIQCVQINQKIRVSEISVNV